MKLKDKIELKDRMELEDSVELEYKIELKDRMELEDSVELWRERKFELDKEYIKMLARIIINYSSNHTTRKSDFISFDGNSIEIKINGDVFLNGNKIEEISTLLEIIKEKKIVNYEKLGLRF